MNVTRAAKSAFLLLCAASLAVGLQTAPAYADELTDVSVPIEGPATPGGDEPGGAAEAGQGQETPLPELGSGDSTPAGLVGEGSGAEGFGESASPDAPSSDEQPPAAPSTGDQLPATPGLGEDGNAAAPSPEGEDGDNAPEAHLAEGSDQGDPAAPLAGGCDEGTLEQLAGDAVVQALEELPAPHADGWARELDESGVAFRYYAGGVAKTGWLVTNTNPFDQQQGFQRYWLDATGALALNRLIDPKTLLDAGAWYAFATTTGAVVRGKFVSDMGYVYLADNDGRLEAPGWVVSSAYGDGIQRYYIDAQLRAAVPGYSADGWDHYTLPDGRAARGKYVAPNGHVYLANNDARLEKTGWVISAAYDGALQRYWVDAATHACIPGYSTDGWAHYTTPQGYVLRGALAMDGVMRYADNEGSLHEGWVVTGAFGQGIQRYWQRSGAVVCDELIHIGGQVWAFARPEGYVVRGKWVHPTKSCVYLANNDGCLELPGWLVTARYDSGHERYYIAEATHAAVVGHFRVDGKGYYGLPGKGYEARPMNSGIAADNDGVLHYAEGWLVTAAFGQGMQRYWVRDGAPVVDELIEAGAAEYWAYARPEGYVVRGKWADAATGRVYLADNDGRLQKPGWVVSSAYDNGTSHRYHIDADTHAAQAGLFQVGGDYYVGAEGEGYVLTGKVKVDGVEYYASATGALLPIIVATTTAADGVPTQQASIVVDDKAYLFLPSFADISHIEVSASLPIGKVPLLVAKKGSNRFSLQEVLDLTASGITRSEDGTWLFDVKLEGSFYVRTLALMVSSGIKSIFVTSADPVNAGRAYVNASPNHVAQAEVSVLVVDADGSLVYNMDAETGKSSTIKGRGNITWSVSQERQTGLTDERKLPYQIKLSKKEDLLGTGNKNNKAKKWILLANVIDPTLLRNTYALTYAELLGVGSEQFAPVDFYYDGMYQGSYLLVEKIEVGSGRVDIDDLEDAFEKANEGTDLEQLPLARAVNSRGYEFQYVAGASNPKDLSGGYILEVDTAYYKDEPVWFDTCLGQIVVKSPEYCSFEAALYISEYVEHAFEQLIGYAQGSLDKTEVDASLDLDSFIAVSLVQELMLNRDYFRSSTFFYKDAHDRLVAGPVWDFDSSCCLRTDDTQTMGILSSGFTKGQDLIAESRILRSDMYQLWNERGGTAAHNAFDMLQAEKVLIAPSEAMNEVMWGFTKISNTKKPKATYRENFANLVACLQWQFTWFG